MSDPQRYTLALPEISYGMDESNKGEYVLWRDYKRLKAEVERLRASSFVTAVPVEEYEKLKAEVERLRKAGDNLITALDKRDDVFDNSDKRQAIADWNAAKEGRPNE